MPSTTPDLDRLAPPRDVVPAPRGPYAAVKRATDVVAALGLLAVFGLPMLAIAAWIRADSPGPALYRQKRSGRGSGEFVIFKFRTMAAGTPDVASHLMEGRHAAVVTRAGAFLRRTSLDELPQLLNILRGEMTLVGPRPALWNQFDLIAMRQAAGVDALKPGVTGWAQINGRDDIPMDRKVALDRHYLERAGAAMDLWILARTPFALVLGRGVN